MVRVILLALVLVATARAAEVLAPTEIVKGRIHLVKVTNGTVAVLPVLTRGAEPLVSVAPPYVLNPKSALMVVEGDANIQAVVRAVNLTAPTLIENVDTSHMPGIPAGTSVSVLSGTKPVRVIVRPHTNHGALHVPHYDFVAFYPPLE